EPADRHRHQEGRQNEGETDERRAAHARVNEAEADRELGRERARRELREGQGLEVLLPAEPPAPLDQIPLHVAHERDGPAEAEASQIGEVAEERARRSSRGRGGVGHRAPSRNPSQPCRTLTWLSACLSVWPIWAGSPVAQKCMK